MCGISGFFAFRGAADAAETERLRRVSAAMAQRGPDAQGEWASPDGRVRLAHRRLAIIDLSSSGDQPMRHAESGCMLVFNGEIYNYRELAAELQRAGRVFRSHSDSEVLLHGYAEWGEALLPRLRGMFAFALWDPARSALWLARDPYGIKPLYYGERAGRLFFASQVRPLRDHAALDTGVDPAGVVGFLLAGSVLDPHTCYRGIRALPAGCSVWVSAAGLQPERSHASVAEVWARAAQAPEVLEREALDEKVRQAVKSSVRAHRIADVPVGAFLSAGIDSASLVALMAEDGGALRTLTLGFESFRNSAIDETGLAAEVGARYGVENRAIWIDDAAAEASLPAVLRDMDQPSVDGFNTWLISQQAAAHGLKVVVSGLGGDELFGGYATFAALPSWQARLRPWARVPGMLAVLAAGSRVGQRLGLLHAKSEAVPRLGGTLAGLYLARRGLFMPWELARYVDPDVVRAGLAALQPPAFLGAIEGDSPAAAYAGVAALEATCYMRNQLLRDSDWASMAHSLELRTPLVDFQLLRELAPALVARAGAAAGKQPLARAPRPPLPEAVVARRKSGFFLPLDRWVRQSERLAQWRRHPQLQSDRATWARRMAYTLLAEAHPDIVLGREDRPAA